MQHKKESKSNENCGSNSGCAINHCKCIPVVIVFVRKICDHCRCLQHFFILLYKGGLASIWCSESMKSRNFASIEIFGKKQVSTILFRVISKKIALIKSYKNF